MGPHLKSRNKNDHNNLYNYLFSFGERAGVRTRDPLIKSQMLYRLSYALPIALFFTARDAAGIVLSRRFWTGSA